jgi:hypothetical protein
MAIIFYHRKSCGNLCGGKKGPLTIFLTSFNTPIFKIMQIIFKKMSLDTYVVALSSVKQGALWELQSVWI